MKNTIHGKLKDDAIRLIERSYEDLGKSYTKHRDDKGMVIIDKEYSKKCIQKLELLKSKVEDAIKSMSN